MSQLQSWFLFNLAPTEPGTCRHSKRVLISNYLLCPWSDLKLSCQTSELFSRHNLFDLSVNFFLKKVERWCCDRDLRFEKLSRQPCVLLVSVGMPAEKSVSWIQVSLIQCEDIYPSIATKDTHMIREWSWEPPLSWPNLNCSRPKTSGTVKTFIGIDVAIVTGNLKFEILWDRAFA